MELKSYQSQVINDLRSYLEVLHRNNHLAKSFKEYWESKGVTGMDAYKNNVQGVPHVCVKVPTAGGKTFIAVNALKIIFEAFNKNAADRPKFVVWLVPSLTILDQTFKSLSNPEHPYRKQLNQHFRNRVAIYEKKDLLMGVGFSNDSVREQLSIVVMSFDSLRAKNKEDLKIFKENGYLASFENLEEATNSEWLTEHEPTSLINVIRSLKPVVIVDESHNAESLLSIEMLQNLNPDFILDLTATPKNNSNIISFVDTMALKLQNMVKLPVIVANQTSREIAIEGALVLRNQIEQIAIEEQKKGGQYIRPIILFQAQPKTGDDATTFQKIKKSLESLNIPSEQIKIKVSSLDELKGLDLWSCNCPVRYIITVNALKEGWDCPFAYILVSLADKSSAVDVEQILGRVLRMPYVQQHGNDLLNMCYVFTASNKFSATIQSVIKALNRAGFSDNDYRTIECETEKKDDIPESQAATTIENDIFAISTEWNTLPEVLENAPLNLQTSVKFIESIKNQAIQQNKEFETKARNASEYDTHPDLENKMNKHKIKPIFINEVSSIILPQFFIRVETGGFFDSGNELQLLERYELLKDFKLSNADSNINFSDVDGEIYQVDLESHGNHEYSPKPFKLDVAKRARFNDIILASSRESQIRDVVDRIHSLIGDMSPIADSEIKYFLNRIVNSMQSDQVKDCLEHDVSYVRKIKEKIKSVSEDHAIMTFNHLLDVGKIVIKPSFSFPEIICPSANAPAFSKTLYSTEASVGEFESTVIGKIVELENIKWWHRNLSRGHGFRINGFVNHYPDFIVKTNTGKIVIIEAKGDDRDNSDSAKKLKLGKRWESEYGHVFKYIMVFENKPIPDAHKLSDALTLLAEI